ncbi:hypothetical protein RND81_06G153500 [Saponaria officinalis]|uniref:F-box domain-containing protein n=1 Tax=Saponaria officinalis TaxID=3572 RepID=A0AAW1KC48_SAPOF
MHHSTTYRKILEMGRRGSSDRISSLPDELLANVLSFLPTLNAVRTSILSRRWRHLFTLTRNLSFYDREYFGTASLAQCEERKMSFERFVYGVLALHSMSHIHKFSLALDERSLKYDCSHLLVWITAAVLKGVQHLHLRIGNHPNALPSCILNCQTLTVLRIHTSGYDLSVPWVVCLPNLRTLDLRYIRFLDGDSVKRFFVGCPQLKELAFFECQLTTDRVRVSATKLQKLNIFCCSGHVVIDAPNLANLLYVSTDFSSVYVKNLGSLLSVVLWPLINSKPSQVQALRDMIRGAVNARELILNDSPAQLFTVIGDNPVPTYSKLERLQLGHCCRYTWKYLMVWLANSPQLETIIFKKGLITENDTEHELHSDVALPPFSSNVKTVEVGQFRGHKMELLLLKYLLENAGVLQKLIIFKDGTMMMKQELQASKELLLLPKASKYCTIELKEQ